jgi:hypothetical protein
MQNRSKFSEFCPKHFAEENTLSIVFAGTRNLRFESLSQNTVAKNFKNSVRKDYF